MSLLLTIGARPVLLSIGGVQQIAVLQGSVAEEAQARQAADTAEAQARQAADTAEAEAREAADTSKVNNTQTPVAGGLVTITGAFSDSSTTQPVIAVTPSGSVRALAGTDASTAMTPADVATYHGQYVADLPSGSSDAVEVDAAGGIGRQLGARNIDAGREITLYPFPTAEDAKVDVWGACRKERQPDPLPTLVGGFVRADPTGAIGLRVTADRIDHPDIESVRRRAPAHLYGCTARALRRTLAKIDDLLSGGSRLVYLCVGDSLTAGQGADGSDGDNGLLGAAVQSWPYKLVARLARHGLPASSGSLCGAHNVLGNMASGASYAQYDARTTGLQDGAIPSLGGALFYLSGAATFAPGGLIDTVEVWTRTYPGAPAITVSAGGANLGTIATNAAEGYQRSVLGLAGAPAAATITFAPAAAYDGLSYVRAYNSTVPAIDVVNAGACGWRTSDWTVATSPSSPRHALAAVAPDLLHLKLGTNDYRLGVAVAPSATYANMAALIGDQQARGGDCIVTLPRLSAPAAAGIMPNWPVQQATLDAVRQAAQDLGAPVIDLGEVLGSYYDASVAGLAYADGIHDLRRAYGVEAGVVAGLLASLT